MTLLYHIIFACQQNTLHSMLINSWLGKMQFQHSFNLHLMFCQLCLAALNVIKMSISRYKPENWLDYEEIINVAAFYNMFSLARHATLHVWLVSFPQAWSARPFVHFTFFITAVRCLSSFVSRNVSGGHRDKREALRATAVSTGTPSSSSSGSVGLCASAGVSQGTALFSEVQGFPLNNNTQTDSLPNGFFDYYCSVLVWRAVNATICSAIQIIFILRWWICFILQQKMLKHR